MFRTLVKIHLKHILHSNVYKLIISLIVLVFTFATVEEAFNYQGFDQNVLPSAALAWPIHYAINDVASIPLFIFFLYPLVTNCIYSDAYYIDKSNGTLYAFSTRTSIKNHIFASLFALFIVVFFTYFVILLLFQCLSFITFPISSSSFAVKTSIYDTLDMPTQSGSMLFGELFATYPYRFNFIYMIYISIFASCIAILTYSISLLGKLKRPILIGSTALLYLLLNLILPMELEPAILLLPYMYPPTPTLTTWISYPLGMLVISILICTLAIKKRDVCL